MTNYNHNLFIINVFKKVFSTKNISIKLSLCLLILFFGTKTEAQRRGTGLILNDAAYNQTPTLPKFEGVKYNNVPINFSLKPNCPTPGDQFTTSTCVGWAVGYGALTIMKAAAKGMTNTDSINRVAHSAFYIYNRVATDCKVGAELSAALNLVQTEGDCLTRTFSNDLKNCEKTPTESATQEARFYKVKDFVSVFKLDDAVNVKITKMQQTIAAGNPVVVAMHVTNSFYNIQNGDEYWSPLPNEQGVEAHAMVVVGYDAVKKWFELMNSWGNRWGDKGFIKVKEADFVRFAQYAYQILPEDRSLLRGSFSFRTVKNGGDSFENTPVKFDFETKTYKTQQEDWKIGDIFQLVAHQLPKGKYVYIFSVDSDNQWNQHYPMTEQSVYIPSLDAEIVIPDPETAMQISQAGEDNLCVLYADRPISDIKARYNKVANAKGDFRKRLKAGFDDILINDNKIKYNPNEMQCEVTGETGNKTAVALILTIKSSR